MPRRSSKKARASRPSAPPAADSSVLVKVKTAGAKKNTAQRTFNNLTSRIRKRRAELAAWNDLLPELYRRLAAELAPVEEEIRTLQRRLALRLDALLSRPGKGERLSKAKRAVVIEELLDIIDQLLVPGPDPELEEIRDRHSEISSADLREAELEQAEEALRGLFGEAVIAGHEATNVEELFAHAYAKAEELAAQRAQDEAQRRKAQRGGRRTQAEWHAEIREKAQAEAGRSLREVFRKLASALHPDREPDPAERQRKTELMQRANQAYERNDLLALLTLQMETEQIDAEHLATLPAERLRHYNTVLEDQLRTLEQELRERLEPLCFDFYFEKPWFRLTTTDVEEGVEERILDARSFRDQLDADLTALDDPRRRQALLNRLVQDKREEEMELEPMLDLFMDEFDFAEPEPPRRGRRKGRK